VNASHHSFCGCSRVGSFPVHLPDGGVVEVVRIGEPSPVRPSRRYGTFAAVNVPDPEKDWALLRG
jgi:hypothetical protein